MESGKENQTPNPSPSRNPNVRPGSMPVQQQHHQPPFFLSSQSLFQLQMRGEAGSQNQGQRQEENLSSMGQTPNQTITPTGIQSTGLGTSFMQQPSHETQIGPNLMQNDTEVQPNIQQQPDGGISTNLQQQQDAGISTNRQQQDAGIQPNIQQPDAGIQKKKNVKVSAKSEFFGRNYSTDYMKALACLYKTSKEKLMVTAIGKDDDSAFEPYNVSISTHFEKISGQAQVYVYNSEDAAIVIGTATFSEICLAYTISEQDATKSAELALIVQYTNMEAKETKLTKAQEVEDFLKAIRARASSMQKLAKVHEKKREKKKAKKQQNVEDQLGMGNNEEQIIPNSEVPNDNVDPNTDTKDYTFDTQIKYLERTLCPVSIPGYISENVVKQLRLMGEELYNGEDRTFSLPAFRGPIYENKEISYCRYAGTYHVNDNIDDYIKFSGHCEENFINRLTPVVPELISSLAFVHNAIMGNLVYLDKSFAAMVFAAAWGITLKQLAAISKEAYAKEIDLEKMCGSLFDNNYSFYKFKLVKTMQSADYMPHYENQYFDDLILEDIRQNQNYKSMGVYVVQVISHLALSHPKADHFVLKVQLKGDTMKIMKHSPDYIEPMKAGSDCSNRKQRNHPLYQVCNKYLSPSKLQLIKLYKLEEVDPSKLPLIDQIKMTSTSIIINAFQQVERVTPNSFSQAISLLEESDQFIDNTKKMGQFNQRMGLGQSILSSPHQLPWKFKASPRNQMQQLQKRDGFPQAMTPSTFQQEQQLVFPDENDEAVHSMVQLYIGTSAMASQFNFNFSLVTQTDFESIEKCKNHCLTSDTAKAILQAILKRIHEKSGQLKESNNTLLGKCIALQEKTQDNLFISYSDKSFYDGYLQEYRVQRRWVELCMIFAYYIQACLEYFNNPDDIKVFVTDHVNERGIVVKNMATPDIYTLRSILTRELSQREHAQAQALLRVKDEDPHAGSANSSKRKSVSAEPLLFINTNKGDLYAGIHTENKHELKRFGVFKSIVQTGMAGLLKFAQNILKAQEVALQSKRKEGEKHLREIKIHPKYAKPTPTIEIDDYPAELHCLDGNPQTEEEHQLNVNASLKRWYQFIDGGVPVIHQLAFGEDMAQAADGQVIILSRDPINGDTVMPAYSVKYLTSSEAQQMNNDPAMGRLKLVLVLPTQLQDYNWQRYLQAELHKERSKFETSRGVGAQQINTSSVPQ